MGEGAEGQAAVETWGSTELSPGGPGHHSCVPDGTCKLGVGAASHGSLEGTTAPGVSISLSVTLAYKDGVLLVSWLLNVHQCLHRRMREQTAFCTSAHVTWRLVPAAGNSPPCSCLWPSKGLMLLQD